MSKSGTLVSQCEQRENARQKILEVIRATEHIARIDIAKATGVSPATVTALTSELLNAGLICEVAPQSHTEGRRGRPRVGLAIRGHAHRIAGIKVARHQISVVVTDFAGHELIHHVSPLDTGRMPGQMLAQEIQRTLEETCKRGDFSLTELSGVGLGLAGMIDAPRNFVYWSSSLEERNTHFADTVETLLQCPVFIDNDANLVAKAEHLFGAGRNCSNFIVITIEHGVGMGVVIDGQIYRGSRGCGAEFGHTKVQLEGALCQCGQRGCLEAYVGDYALLREANTSSGGERYYPTLASLFSAAQKGDAIAQSVLDRARRMFALGLANIVNIFDPGKIILAGARLSFDHLYSERVIDEMQQWVVDIGAPMPEILVHDWGDLMWAKGAAAYAIEEVSALAVKRLTWAAT